MVNTNLSLPLLRMYTTYITLIAKHFGTELPVFLVKMIAEMTKDRQHIPRHITDCAQHPYCQPGHCYSERTILFCDTGRLASMVNGYNSSFEDLLYPGQNLRSALVERQKRSDVFLNLRAFLYEINMFWKENVESYKKIDYYDYKAPSLILKTLPDLERVFNSVLHGRRISYQGPVGNAEIYLKPRYTSEELKILWPALVKA